MEQRAVGVPPRRGRSGQQVHIYIRILLVYIYKRTPLAFLFGGDTSPLPFAPFRSRSLRLLSSDSRILLRVPCGPACLCAPLLLPAAPAAPPLLPPAAVRPLPACPLPLCLLCWPRPWPCAPLRCVPAAPCAAALCCLTVPATLLCTLQREWLAR